MPRGSRIIRALTVAFVAASLAASGLSLATEVESATAPEGPAQQWQPGTHYDLLAVPQPTSVGRDKVEVIEIFWYGCSHCFALDPALESWKLSKPAHIEFVRIPVIWSSPTHTQHARLYFTLQALNRLDLHPKVFEAIHRGGRMLAGPTDDAARAQQMAFLKEHGVTEQDFNNAYDSAAVKTNLRRAAQATEAYAAGSVPLIVVNGRYVSNVSKAGGTGQLLALINDLAANVRKRR
jgi:thiol:disulfide interchange protein DsbA